MKYGKVEHVGKYRQQCRGLYELLQEYVRAGCMVCLEGKEAEPDEITTACLREDVNYMMDFVPSEEDPDRISVIDFNRIREEDEDMLYDGCSHRNIAALEGWCS